MRDRIIDFRRVPASELKPSPTNWRVHPEVQQSALTAMLHRIGIIDAVIARQLPDGGLELVDGHLRADLLELEQVPTIIVDLDAEEAGEALLTLDPLAAMADINSAVLRDLVDGLADDFPLSEYMLMPEVFPPTTEWPKLLSPDAIKLTNMTFGFNDEQLAVVTEALEAAQAETNAKTAALTLICRQWLEARKT